MMIVSSRLLCNNCFDVVLMWSAINVTFSRLTYGTIEDDGLLQFTLLFTNPSAFDINITVTTSDLTATGVYTHMHMHTQTHTHSGS